MITPRTDRIDSASKTSYEDMNRICSNINELCGTSLKTDWSEDDIVDKATWDLIISSAKTMSSAVSGPAIVYEATWTNLNNIEAMCKAYYDHIHGYSGGAELNALSLSNGTLSPAFSPSTYSYTANVSDLDSVLTAASEYSAVKIYVNGVLVNSGDTVVWENASNTVSITATLNGQVATYTLTVNCSYTEAALTSLSIGGESIPVSDYMDFIVTSTSQTVVTSATGTVELQLDGVTVTSPITLDEGGNDLAIIVTADDVKEYHVTIDCQPPIILNAILLGIDVQPMTFTIPNFSAAVTEYEYFWDQEFDEYGEQIEQYGTVSVSYDDGVGAHLYWNDAEIGNGSEVEFREQGDTLRVVTYDDDTEDNITYEPMEYIVHIAPTAVEQVVPYRANELISGESYGYEEYEEY